MSEPDSTGLIRLLHEVRAHESATSLQRYLRHIGVDATESQIKEILKDCPCRLSARPRPTRPKIGGIWGERFGQLWSLDLFEIQIASKVHVCCHILDTWSRLSYVDQVQTQTSEAVWTCMEHAMMILGPPEAVMTDQGSCFHVKA